MSETEPTLEPSGIEHEDSEDLGAALPRGPQGGRTTRTRSGMVRKSLMLREEEARALRRAAYEGERSEAEIVREAVRRFLGLPVDPAEPGDRSPDER